MAHFDHCKVERRGEMKLSAYILFLNTRYCVEGQFVFLPIKQRNDKDVSATKFHWSVCFIVDCDPVFVDRCRGH